MKQPGFLLLEMIISLMISAFLLTTMLIIYNQINKNATRISNIITIDMQILAIKQRVCLDFQGICSLWFTQQDYDKIKKARQKPKGPSTTPQNTKPKQSEDEDVDSLKTNTDNTVNNFLYSQNNNNNFEFATFVTTNPLSEYPANQHRTVRVVYRLIQDPAQPNLFMLQRKEMVTFSNEFNKDTLLKDNFYTLANNIVSCRFEYGYLNITPEQRKQGSTQEWQIIWSDAWSSVQDMKQTKSYAPLLPEIVRITLQCYHQQNASTTTHTLCCQLLLNQESTFQSFALQRYTQQQNATPSKESIAHSITSSLGK